MTFFSANHRVMNFYALRPSPVMAYFERQPQAHDFFSRSGHHESWHFFSANHIPMTFFRGPMITSHDFFSANHISMTFFRGPAITSHGIFVSANHRLVTFFRGPVITSHDIFFSANHRLVTFFSRSGHHESWHFFSANHRLVTFFRGPVITSHDIFLAPTIYPWLFFAARVMTFFEVRLSQLMKFF